MLTSIVLDALLILIILMMVPLGFLRGGLREVSTSAALLLGILMAGQWAGRWADSLVDAFDMGRDTAEFAVSIAIVVVITGIVGYGGSAAFTWRPGPGGRMYGAFLALMNAVVFIGFLINSYIAAIFEGEVPETIERSFVARAVSVGFEWVLLIGTAGILVATIFGMFVRERGDDESFETPAPKPEDLYRVRYEEPRPRVRPLNDAESTQEMPAAPAKPVRIREVRHWEDEPSEPAPETRYGSGWRQTWPEDQQRTSPTSARQSQPPASRATSGGRRDGAGSSQKDVLRNWMNTDRGKQGGEK